MDTVVGWMASPRRVAFGLLLVMPCAVRAEPRPIAYVANGASDTISVIDTSTNAVAATVEVGAGLRPFGIALRADDGLAYVTNPGTDSVSVVDLQSQTTNHIALPNCPALGCRPEAAVVSPDGLYVYVLNHPFDSVWVEVIDAVTQRIVAHTAANTCDTVGGVATIAISPDGSTVYATGPCGLSVIDTASRTELLQIPGYYYDVAVTPDGSQVYLAGYREVTVVDTATNQIAARLVVAPSPSQQSPSLVAISPDGRLAYVVAGTALLLIDVATADVRGTVDLGQDAYPGDIAVLPGGAQIVLATSEALLLLDTSTNTLAKRVALPRVPRAMAISADGAFAYLTHELDLYSRVDPGTLSRVDLTTGALSQLFPAAVPSAVAATPDGTVVYAANYGSDEIAVIDPSAAVVRTAIPVHQPQAVVFDSTGTLAYVSARSSAQRDAAGVIEVIDTRTSARVASIEVPGVPGSLVLAPKGDRLYAAITGGIAVIDTTSGATRTVPFRPYASGVDLAITPDGGFLYEAFLTILDPHDAVGEVRVVDTNDDQILSTIGSGGFSSIVIDPDGATAYAMGRSGIAVIDTTTTTIASTIQVFGSRLAITPDGRFLYLVSGDAVTVVDTMTKSTVARVPVGKGPSAITIAAAPGAQVVPPEMTRSGGCSMDPRSSVRPGQLLLLLPLLWLVPRLRRVSPPADEAGAGGCHANAFKSGTGCVTRMDASRSAALPAWLSRHVGRAVGAVAIAHDGARAGCCSRRHDPARPQPARRAHHDRARRSHDLHGRSAHAAFRRHRGIADHRHGAAAAAA